MSRLYGLAREVSGPLYVRMLLGETARIFAPGTPLKLNRARVLNTPATWRF